jgi:hypothetical protein
MKGISPIAIVCLVIHSLHMYQLFGGACLVKILFCLSTHLNERHKYEFGIGNPSGKVGLLHTNY